MCFVLNASVFVNNVCVCVFVLCVCEACRETSLDVSVLLLEV